MSSNKLTQIVDLYWEDTAEELRAKHVYIPGHVQKTFKKILNCRTEALGCHVYKCPDCGEYVLVKHSCKDRFCSSCGTAYTDSWAEKTTVMLSSLDVSYYFLTFTIPKGLEELAKYNKKIMLNILFQSAWYAVRSYCRKKGVVPGMLAQLQTSGRWLNWHPHIHAVCSAGGINIKQTEWKDIYLSADAIRERFKQRFMKLVRKYYRIGVLQVTFLQQRKFNQFLDEQYRQHWQFDRSDVIEYIKPVITYISRYLLKPPISDMRICWYNYKQICFFFTDYRTNVKEKYILTMFEFFRRLIEHVQLPSFHMTRNYGIFSSRGKNVLYALAKKYRPAKYHVQMSLQKPANGFRERHISKFGQDPLRCKACQQELQLFAVYYRNQLNCTFKKLLHNLRAPPVIKSTEPS
ncbi:MAG: transposase [Eubacteriales bacterium]